MLLSLLAILFSILLKRDLIHVIPYCIQLSSYISFYVCILSLKRTQAWTRVFQSLLNLVEAMAFQLHHQMEEN